MNTAVAYFRTSSATNVGDDKDSQKRQREAVQQYAKRNRINIVGEFYDAAVSGVDLIEDRPGFSALLDQIEGNGVRTVIVEGIDRLARGMESGVLGLALLRAREVTLLDSSGTDLTDDVDEMTEAMISISLVFATLEKKRLVKKLKVARDRKSKKIGRRIEGQKGLKITAPEMVKEAKRLRRKPRNGKRLSFRTISAELASMGITRDNGEPYSAMTIKRVTT
jgi:DNA invertase Pin-like site-specific DNA recombinase